MTILAETRMADDRSATGGKSSTWPGGEPQKIRDAYDRQQGARK